ncbi:hypothetical protein AC070_06335, partial [Fannyhessea vaginae]
QFSYSLPGTSLTKACETQFLCRPDLAEVELLLWVCYIALELKAQCAVVLSKGRVGPQSILLPALWEPRNNLLCTVLLQHTGNISYKELRNTVSLKASSG